MKPTRRSFLRSAGLNTLTRVGLAGLVLGLAVATSACFVDREYSNETIIEFEACATFAENCSGLTEFRVIGRELREEGRAVVGDRIRFRDVTPNAVITFDIEGYAGDRLVVRASCDIGATPYTTVEADCRNDVRIAN